jgi:ATP-binding cassette subfamily B protein
VESGTHEELLALGERWSDLYRTHLADGERRTVDAA